MNMYAGSSITLSFIIGIIIVIIAHIVSNPILKLIGTPENIIELSSAYINILYFGVPFGCCLIILQAFAVLSATAKANDVHNCQCYNKSCA